MSESRDEPRHRPRTQDRQILALAVPALATLLAEPIFLLADTAIVGHLGADELAGLGIAAAVLQAAVGLSIFLAYGTTAATARQLGAGRLRQAMSAGVDGLWLAALLGALLAVVGAVTAPWLVEELGASPRVAPYAVAYLRTSLPGLPAMLVVLAATGVLRGLLDTRTPFVVAVGGALANIGLNWVLVYPAGLGIAGSGLGTSISQLGMGLVLGGLVAVRARREGASLRPHLGGIRTAAGAGVPLIVRSVAMRVTLLLTTVAAAAQGDVQLAGFQVVMTIWTFTTFALDALAIAGQALTGKSLGEDDVPGMRSATRRMVQWGLGLGALLVVILIAISPWVGRAFTSDPAVVAVIAVTLVPVALAMPLAGYVFVLDGVLIGGGDGRFLGIAAVANTLVYLPLVLAVLAFVPRGTAGLAWLWAAFCFGWMGSRALALGWRNRRAWYVVGA